MLWLVTACDWISVQVLERGLLPRRPPAAATSFLGTKSHELRFSALALQLRSYQNSGTRHHRWRQVFDLLTLMPILCIIGLVSPQRRCRFFALATRRCIALLVPRPLRMREAGFSCERVQCVAPILQCGNERLRPRVFGKALLLSSSPLYAHAVGWVC